MFSQDPLPVPAQALAVPDLADKVSAYVAPFRDLVARGVPAMRFPPPLRQLEALPELMSLVCDPYQGFLAYERRYGATSERAADALAGVSAGRLVAVSVILAPRFAELRAADPAEREEMARVFDACLDPDEREVLEHWDWEGFVNGCIARLSRAVKIEPVDPSAYASMIDAYAARWGNDPHDRLAGQLAEDRSVPAALARMFMHTMSFRLVEDSGTRTDDASPGSVRRKIFGGDEGTIAQSRTLVTDAGVLHCEARIGARVKLSVELEPVDGGRRTRLIHLSHKRGPELLDAIETDLRRTVDPPRP